MKFNHANIFGTQLTQFDCLNICNDIGHQPSHIALQSPFRICTKPQTTKTKIMSWALVNTKLLTQSNPLSLLDIFIFVFIDDYLLSQSTNTLSPSSSSSLSSTIFTWWQATPVWSSTRNQWPVTSKGSVGVVWKQR